MWKFYLILTVSAVAFFCIMFFVIPGPSSLPHRKSEVHETKDAPIYGTYTLKTCDRDRCTATHSASLVWLTYANGEKKTEIVDLSNKYQLGGPRGTLWFMASAANLDLSKMKFGPITKIEICLPYRGGPVIYRCTALYEEPLAVWEKNHKR